MAYLQSINRSAMATLVLKMLGLLQSGGSASTDEATEAGYIINAAIRTLDSAGWFRKKITHAQATLTAGTNSCDLATDVVSVEAGFLFNATDGEIGAPVIVTSVAEVYRHGPVEAAGVPTHCWIKVEEEAADTVAAAHFNRKASVNMTFEYWYKANAAILTSTSTIFYLGDEWLRMVLYLSALNWGRMNQLDPNLLLELQANLQIAADLAASGQYVLDPTVLTDILLQQGQAPQPTNGGKT